MKQTAVEWLLNEIDMQYPEINLRRKEWMVDKAKEMMEDQIKMAFVDGKWDGKFINLNSEQYYNETYKINKL
jgi:hypothetical protein